VHGGSNVLRVEVRIWGLVDLLPVTIEVVGRGWPDDVRRGHRLEREWMASSKRGCWDGTGTKPKDDTVDLEAAQGERMPITWRQEARRGGVKRKKACGTLPSV
jgi:hypothetical protein